MGSNGLTSQEREANLDQLTDQFTRQLAKGGVITLAGSIFGKIIQFGMYILLGRILGASDYGLYVLGFSLAQLASRVSILGLQNGLVRFISIYKGKGDLRRIKGTLVSAFSIAIFVSFIVGGVLFGSSGLVAKEFFDDPQLSSVVKVFAIALPFFVLMQLFAHSARGFQKMKYYVAVQNLIWPIIHASIVALAFLIGFRLTGALYGFLLSVVLSALLGCYFLITRLFPKGMSIQSRYENKKLLRFSIPMVFVSFGGIILGQADRLMIGYFMGSSDVGIYDAAGRIAIQLSLVINSFNMAFAPMIANLYNQGQISELREVFKHVTRWIVTLTLPPFLMIVSAPGIFVRLFGGEFLAGSIVLVALATAYIINAAAGAVGYMLIMSGKQNIELVNILSMAVINIGFNIWLIPLYGILGAGIATGLSLTLINIIRVIEVHRIIGIKPFNKKWLKPLIAGAAALLLTVLMEGWILNEKAGAFYWVRTFGFCPLFYMSSLVLLRVEPEDMELVQAFREKIASLI